MRARGFVRMVRRADLGYGGNVMGAARGAFGVSRGASSTRPRQFVGAHPERGKAIFKMYNSQAESFGAGKVKAFAPEPYATPNGWCRFDNVYSDIADATPTEGAWRGAELVGQLPTIAALAPKTQVEIVAVVLRDMQRLPDGADRIRRVRAGWFEWEFTDKG